MQEAVSRRNILWVQYKLAVTVHWPRASRYLIDYCVCLCLKFPVVSIYDLSDVVNCLFQVFTAELLEAVLFPSTDQQSGIYCQMICVFHLLILNEPRRYLKTNLLFCIDVCVSGVIKTMFPRLSREKTVIT